ncbi:response regulator [Variovorax sp. ZT4R33]|uniref:response regulator n=1 Tax=Variovorax sp. ZT4R33 TaxID=3443743 RepID=UPI003F47F9AE
MRSDATPVCAAPVSVGVVDDHPIVRAGLADLLSYEDGIHVAGEAGDAVGALDLVRNRRLDVLMLDLDLPGRSGLDMLAMLRSKAPQVAVLVFTGYPAEKYAVKLLQQGAKAYLQKTCDLAELPVAIRTLGAGRRYLTPTVSELLAQQFDARNHPPHAGLTDRELQVLLKLARGVRTEKIADHLALSVKTISTYRARLLAKLDLDSNNDLTYYALKHQLLE